MTGTDKFAIKANLAEPRSAMRTTASCWVINTNPGWGGERVQVWARSRGGRMISTWIATKRLTNIRVAWAPPKVREVVFVLYDTREEATPWVLALAAQSAEMLRITN